MKSSNWKIVTLVLSLSLVNLIGTANAGLIVNTDNDSFIDTSTGLEWMDFGINNHLSHNDVVAQLDVGGEYYGWALPSEQQVRTMWLNAFSNLGADVYEENVADGNFNFKDGANEQGSVFTELMNTMSYNELRNADANNERQYSYGRYITATGMSRVTFYAYTDRLSEQNDYDMVRFENSGSSDYTSVNESNSTLLIKMSSVVDVPEPSTFAIFALGMIGLASRRFTLQA
jgi:hypothetical protein